MPKRIPADDRLIFALFQETGSGREVARRLNLHENTIYNALRRYRGVCQLCGNPVAAGKKHCAACLEILRTRMRVKRKERIRQGICAECNDPVAPPSRMYCAPHRLSVIHRNSVYDAKQRIKRGAPEPGIPNERQRQRHIREKYGLAGIKVWQRDNGQCILCHVSFQEKAIHIHHINGEPTQSTEDNMACLCFRCHKLTHLLMEHPHMHQALEWFHKTYKTASTRRAPAPDS